MTLMKKELLKNVSLKVKQSEYFLKHMKIAESSGNVEEFYYVYSAFLSSSRTALQYIEKHRKNFYKNKIKYVTLKELFQKERNFDIHETPSQTQNLGESIVCVEIEVSDKHEIDAKYPTNKNDIAVQNLFKVYFKNTKNFDDTNRIVSLAEKYLVEIVDLKNRINN